MNKRLNAIQSLRFLAFLAIFGLHFLSSTSKLFAFGDYYIYAAAGAVSFFIILSGFLHGYSVSSGFKSHSFLGKIKEILFYVWSKIKHFLPLYLTLMLVLYYYNIIKGGVTFIDALPYLLRCIFLVQSWHNGGYFLICGPAWFLSTIIFLYACKLPLQALLNKIEKKGGSLFLWLAFFFSLSILFIYSKLILDNALFDEFYLYVLPVSRLPEYFMGMILGRLLSKTRTSKKYVTVWTLIELAVLFFWIYSPVMKDPISWNGYRVLRWLLPNILTISVFSLERGLVSKFLSFKPFVKLGDAAFGGFLIHTAVLFVLLYEGLAPEIRNRYWVGLVITIFISLLYNEIVKIIKDFIKEKKKGTHKSSTTTTSC